MNSRILHAAMFCPTPEGFFGLPILLWGPPGIGKTGMIRAFARSTGLPHERLSPAERGEGQFGVVPVPREDGMLHYPPPDWAKKFERGGILFVDEINTAAPALQAPLLGLVQLRTIGSHTLGSRTRCIGAANETVHAAGGWDLAPALANRFGHFEFDGLDTSSWVEGLLGGFGTGADAGTPDPVVEEERVLTAWPSVDAKARGLIGGFIYRRPELLRQQPKNADAKASRAWASPRSVEYAAVALASAAAHGLNEIDTDELLSGFVGQAWVAEFRTWQNNADLPDPADVLDGKVTFKHEERRLDRSLAMLSACSALVIPEKAAKRGPRAAVCWQLIGSVIKDAADVAIPAARALVANRVTQLVVGEKAWNSSGKETLHRLLPILSASGL